MEIVALAVGVQDQSEVGTARRTAVSIADRLGFSETESGKVAIVATELATNLVRHAGGGELILQSLRDGDAGLELISVDRGPGIANLSEALRDGFSTGGTQGTGLGAVSRLADHLDLFSTPTGGTVLLARFHRQPAGSGAPRLAVGAVALPHRGESACGDAWAAALGPGVASVIVADGLGHGPAAAEAAAEAVRVFRGRPGAAPAEILELAHAALRPTRGAAVGIAEVRADQGVVIFAGVGNIGGGIVAGGRSRSVVSHAGIVGHQCRKIQEFTYPWRRDATLVLHSDGLQTRWDLDRYPGLAARHPTLIAAMLYRDHVRGRDDVGVVVVRETTPE